MSGIAAQKESLFGNKGGSSSASSATTTVASASSNTTSMTSSTSKTAKLTTAIGSRAAVGSIPAALKTKKVAEGLGYQERANAQMKTSLFKWSPDHLAAAPLFEMAAKCYETAGEYDTAIELFVKAADCHEAYGSQSASGSVLLNASKAAKIKGNVRQTVELMKRAAECWGIGGDLQKFGETLAKAALELEPLDAADAASMYKKAVEIMLPQNDPTGVHPAIVEILRNNFALLVRSEMYKEAIDLARVMIQVSDHFDTESTTAKCMVSITILQLAMGDAVQAQRTYTQEHLGNSKYLRSKECELADMLVMAFNNLDVDLLDTALAFHHLNYLDKEIQVVAKQLSLIGADSVERIAAKASSISESSPPVARPTPLSGRRQAQGQKQQQQQQQKEEEEEGVEEPQPYSSETPPDALSAVTIDGNVEEDNHLDVSIEETDEESNKPAGPPPVVSNITEEDEDELDLS